MPLPPEIESSVTESFIRSSGPGGQHVNKVSTGVRLVFDASGSGFLTDEVRTRLFRLAGRRVSSDGLIVIEVTQFRSQKKNRGEARRRLEMLIEKAKKKPKLRRKTLPSRASKERRLKAKKRRGEHKLNRRKPSIE